jgi:hypothetical protein
VVEAYDRSAMWVAEDNLSTHIDELIDKEEAALEHLLVDKHGTLRLVATTKKIDNRSGVKPGQGASAMVIIEPSRKVSML